MKIAPNLMLPPEAVTETFAMLAKRGTGKSNAAVVMAEEMWDAGYQWVAIDPKGDWWGIRSSRDGKGPGLPVLVLGGRHGDLPLEAGHGTPMANLVVERGVTVVLDVSLFSKAEQIRFVTDFAETLFRQLGDDPRPLHLFLEEAEEFLPQQVRPNVARMVGAYSKIAKQGRTLGLGVTLITQRSASLNKDALSQTDTLVLFRTTSPHDRKAVEAWAQHHGEQKEVAQSLASLQPGESWVLSPGFLGRIERIQWRRRRTFDSGATPVTGAGRRRDPVTVADIDLGEIKELMAETVERLAAEDPKVLQKRIRELERELVETRAALNDAAEQLDRLAARPAEIVEVIPDRLRPALEAMQAQVQAWDASIAKVLQEIEDQPDAPVAPVVPLERRAPREMGREGTARPAPAARPPANAGSLKLGKAHRAVLTVLARFPDGRGRRQLAALAGLKASGGHFGNVLSELRVACLITGTGDGPYRALPAGFDALGPDFEPLPQGKELLAWWLAKLGRAHRAVLSHLVEAWPAEVERQVLAEAVGLDPTGGHYGNVLSELRTRDLIEGSGLLRAHPDFMAAIDA